MKKKKGKGKSGMKSSKAGDGASAFGNTDFDASSDYSNKLSMQSHDFLQADGGFNPKVGIKGFISQMMNKTPSKDVLKRDNSRSGLVPTKIARPLTHFGSQDAVSEKSEKEEESLSGSDGGSSG